MMVVNHLIVETMDNAHAKPVKSGGAGRTEWPDFWFSTTLIFLKL